MVAVTARSLAFPLLGSTLALLQVGGGPARAADYPGEAALPAVTEAMTLQGMETATSTPSELAALVRTETAAWSKVIKAANIRAE